jgi:hypothetical protein
MGPGRLWAIAAMALLAQAAAWCGICADVAVGPRHDYQLFAGYSPGTVNVFGTARDRQFVVAGFSYGYLCRTPGAVSVYYNATVMPAAIMRVPAQGRDRARWVYGFAVAPLGVTVEFSRRRLYPFLETMGGIVASTEPIPINRPNATGLNFLFDFGGGVRWDIHPGRTLSLGYRFLHISNANTTSFNPGVDNNVIYAGFSFRR